MSIGKTLLRSLALLVIVSFAMVVIHSHRSLQEQRATG